MAAKRLLISSLELEEDALFSKIADKRIETTKKWSSHEDVWG